MSTESTDDLLDQAIARMTRTIAVAVAVRPREAQAVRTMLRLALVETGRAA